MHTRLLVAIFALIGCRSLPPNALRSSEPGPLQRAYAESHSGTTDAEYPQCDTPYENTTGVTEIAIERTPCYGFCSTYTLRLFSDGRVEYRGQASVKFVGVRRGRLAPYFFTQLARAAVGIGFFELQERYACRVTDNPTIYVEVARRGQRKIIQHYAPDWTGPQSLRLFEESVDAVQKYIDWSPNLTSASSGPVSQNYD